MLIIIHKIIHCTPKVLSHLPFESLCFIFFFLFVFLSFRYTNVIVFAPFLPFMFFTMFIVLHNVLDKSCGMIFYIKICKISSIKLKCEGTFGGQCKFIYLVYRDIYITIRLTTKHFTQYITNIIVTQYLSTCKLL